MFKDCLSLSSLPNIKKWTLPSLNESFNFSDYNNCISLINSPI